MLDRYFTRRSVLERLQGGLFGPSLVPFAERLREQGYSHDERQPSIEIDVPGVPPRPLELA